MTQAEQSILFESGGKRGRVLPAFEGRVRRWCSSPPQGEVVKEDSGRTVWRFSGLFVKRFKGFRWFRDPARREFENLLRLRQRAVGCPLPVAHFRGAGSTWLMTAEIEGADAVHELLAGKALSPWELRSLLEGIGGFVSQLHDAGLRHDDLHVGNLLVRRGEFFVLDAHRARVGPSLSRPERIRSLAFLLLSVYRFVPLTGSLRVLRGYGIPRDEIHSVLDRFSAIRTRHSRGRMKWCLKDQGPYARERHRFPFWSGMLYRRRTWNPDLEHLLESEQRVLVKQDPKRRLFRVGDRFLKVMPARMALSTWRNAHGFSLRDVPTARMDGCGIGRPVSWVAGEWLEGLTLAESMKDDRREVLYRVARLVRHMHVRGIFHQDLKANNVLVREGRPFVVDLERVKFPRLVSRANRILNLAQLNAAVGAPVTRTDRLRFLRWYLGRDQAEWRRRREWVDRVMTITIGRRHAWPKK